MLPLDTPAPPGPSAPLVGRDAELEGLRGLITPTRDAGRAVLVTGPAGVGRTRLLGELKRMFREAGRPVIEGVCRATDHRPHGPLVDLLGSAAGLLADLGRPHPRLTRALEVATGYGPALTGEAERVLLFRETVRQALIELAAVRAPLLCLDDLHLAHPGTLALVRHLLENLLTDPAFEWAPDTGGGPAFRGLLALSFRDGPATQSLLDAARTSEIVRHLPLAPLSLEGVRAWLASDAVVGRVHAASRGLPATLIELFEGVPVDVDTVRDRWRHVPEAARPLLDALAVLQVPATAEEIVEVATAIAPDIQAGTAFKELAGLVDPGLLNRALTGGEVRFSFRREEVRERHLARTDPALRAALHCRAAERLALTARGAQAEAVARHALAGGAIAQAVPFALAAADHLRAACAGERAASLLEAVAPAAEGPLADEIRERLADLYREAGALDQERGALAWLTARRPHDVSLALRRAELEARSGDHKAARMGALAALDTQATPEQARALLAVVAEAAYQQGDLDEAAARATAGLSQVLDSATLSLRNTLGKVHLAREALDEAQALFTRNLEQARTLNDAVQQARAQTNLGVVFLQRGDQEAARDMFESTRRLAALHGDLRHLALAVENLGVLFHRQKDFPRALHHYHQSTAAFRQLGHRRQLATTALNLADLYLTMGDPARARRLAHIAGDLIEQGGFKHLLAQQRMLEGDLAREAGDLARAAEHYRAVEALLEKGGSNQRQGPLCWALAELALDRGDGVGALAALDRAQAQPGSQSEAFAARMRSTRGAALTARGQAVEAQAELEAAVAQAEEAGDRETRWQALARLADAHWARGDRVGTLQSLAAAVEAIERVAQDLPASLRTGYLGAPARRAVGDALRRVRAGMPPRGPKAEVAQGAMRRQGGEYKSAWRLRYPQIIGRAPALFPVFNALDRVSGSDSMVLIRGESGTGKELVAAALHARSSRAEGPFVKVNCSAFVETLLLSELFGHEKGSFTGAVASKKGRFELADTGTLFLDEIGDISPNTQVALLRVLQEGTFERVGGTQTLSVDVRVICATHRDLEAMVEQGTFRADLYYRLRGVIIETPPLRERREDIPLLVEHFLARRSQGRPQVHFSRPALASLLQHHWPGNVRELENVVRSVALFADGDRVGLAELAELGDIFRPPDEAALMLLASIEPQGVREEEVTMPVPVPAAPATIEMAAPGDDDDDGREVRLGLQSGESAVFDEPWLERMLAEEGGLAELKRRIEFEAISRALRQADGNITRAAERLGMKRPRLSQIIHATPALGEFKRADRASGGESE